MVDLTEKGCETEDSQTGHRQKGQTDIYDLIEQR